MAKESTKKKKDPGAPKRACSAFLFYSNQIRPQIQQNHPDYNIKDISKIIGTMWNGLSADDRKPFDAMAEKDRERYKREMENYTPPSGQGFSVKKKKDPNAPKKAMSGFMLFSQDHRPDLMKKNPEMKITEVAKLIGQLWQKRSEADKVKYEELATEEKLRYAKEIEQYKASEKAKA